MSNNQQNNFADVNNFLITIKDNKFKGTLVNNQKDDKHIFVFYKLPENKTKNENFLDTIFFYKNIKKALLDLDFGEVRNNWIQGWFDSNSVRFYLYTPEDDLKHFEYIKNVFVQIEDTLNIPNAIKYEFVDTSEFKEENNLTDDEIKKIKLLSKNEN